MGTARFRKVTGSGSQRRHNNSLKLTALSRGLYLGDWGEAEAVVGRSQAKPRGSLVRPVSLLRAVKLRSKSYGTN